MPGLHDIRSRHGASARSATAKNTTEGRTTMAQQRPRRTRFLGRALALAAVIGLGVATPAQAQDPGIEPGSFKISVSDTQAGGHPDVLTEFAFKSKPGTFFGMPTTLPVDDPRDIVVDLPPGLVGNPENFPKCPASKFPLCPIDTQIGEATIDFVPLMGQVTTPIYSIEPPQGAVAQFAFNGSAGVLVQITATVRSDGDYGLAMTTLNTPDLLPVLGVKLDFWGVPGSSVHDAVRDRICSYGMCTRSDAMTPYPSGGVKSGIPVRPFMIAPVECGVATEATIRANSWSNPAFDTQATTIPAFTGCEKMSFKPEISVQPTSREAAAPTGLDVDIEIPQNNEPTGVSTPALKQAVVALPEGMVVSPSGSDGLAGCSDAQIGIGNLDQPACPAGSQIGTVKIESPVMDEDLTGSIYLGTQTREQMLRIFLYAEGGGVQLKLPGKIDADPVTGRLTTTFDDQPMLPANRISLSFKSGPRAVLANPSTCGTKTTDTHITSHGDVVATPKDTFEITEGCAKAFAFTPAFNAGTLIPRAGGFSPFTLDVARSDGQPALNGISLELPEGLLAQLKGNIGQRVGTARVAAGPGSNPFWLSGPVYLEGPYADAPFSLKVMIHAKAGPIDLGMVVVRQRIYVDPTDAHVTVVSDPLPTILHGIPIQLKHLRVAMDKPGFMINPTSCEPQAIHGALNSAHGNTLPVATRFQVGDCGALDLDPTMKLAFTGDKETGKGKHPGLDVELRQKPGGAALKRVEVALPLSVALDPANAKALCTPPQAAARACPPDSIVGQAEAVTPILDRPLSGPVYFVEGIRTTETGRQVKTLPKLLITLRGQVALDIMADSDVKDDKLVSTFPTIPDAPLESFKLTINGGENGILKNTGTNGDTLCHSTQRIETRIDGHNGKRIRPTFGIDTPCDMRVVSRSVTTSRLTVRAGGIGKGRLTVSGSHVRRTSRSISSAQAATIKPRLSQAGRRAARAGRQVRATVTFDPAAKDAKTVRRTVKVRVARSER